MSSFAQGINLENNNIEQLRLNYLYDLEILDTDFDINFDKITKLLEIYFNVPIVLLSLVDSDRQWFKSCIGLNIRETPREVSFCSDAIKNKNFIYIVNDTLNHPLYNNNVLVIGDPKIRFYAGKPICYNDYALGTICIIDKKPRNLNQNDLLFLEICGKLVETEINKINYIKKLKN